jgi:hypothetical protein
MRQKRGAAGLVERGEPVPERGFVVRQGGFPGLVAFATALADGLSLRSIACTGKKT